MSVMCRESLRPFGALLLQVRYLLSHRKALPSPLCYYKLMRQSKILPSTRFYTCLRGLRRLSLIPAGRWTFLVLSPKTFPRCLDPYPGCLSSAFTRFFLESFGLRPALTGSAHPHIHTTTSVWGSLTGLQSFSNV